MAYNYNYGGRRGPGFRAITDYLEKNKGELQKEAGAATGTGPIKGGQRGRMGGSMGQGRGLATAPGQRSPDQEENSGSGEIMETPGGSSGIMMPREGMGGGPLGQKPQSNQPNQPNKKKRDWDKLIPYLS